MKKYGMKTALCKEKWVCDIHGIVPSSSQNMASVSQSRGDDFCAERRAPSANGRVISSSALSPTASPPSPDQAPIFTSSKRNQPLSKDLGEFDFDEFFGHMHATNAASDVAACAKEIGQEPLVCSTSAAAGLEDVDVKQFSNRSSPKVKNLVEAHVCIFQGSAIAPSPSPLKRISTQGLSTCHGQK